MSLMHNMWLASSQESIHYDKFNHSKINTFFDMATVMQPEDAVNFHLFFITFTDAIADV